MLPKIKSFPSVIKSNSDVLTLETNEHTYKYDIGHFRYRENILIDIQRRNNTKCVCSKQFFPFPKVYRRQFKREWLKQFPWFCYSPRMDGRFCLAGVLFGHEFAKGSKVNLLRTDSARSSPSTISDFTRLVEGKRKKKDHDRNRAFHNGTSALLYSIQEKIERNLEDVDEMLDRQFKFEVSENRKILRSIIDTIIFLGRQGLALRGHRVVGVAVPSRCGRIFYRECWQFH